MLQPYFVGRIYFGRDMKQRGQVSDHDMAQFLFDHVDPKFDGYTVHTAQGVWKSEHEASTILEVLLTAENDGCKYLSGAVPEKLRLIAEAYKEQFFQDAVLVTVSPALGTFI